MKVVVKILLIILLLGYLAATVVLFYHSSKEEVCSSVRVQVEECADFAFVDSTYIRNLLAGQMDSIEGRPIQEIDLQRIERFLMKNPYIDSAYSYHTASKNLLINIIPRNPKLLVMPIGQNAYYLGADSSAMPIGDFNLPLCVATGNISKQYAIDKLLPLAHYINEDSLWKNQIQQIHVQDSVNIILYPRVGNHKIVLGEPFGFEEKLAHLQLFYKKVLPKVGWNRYESINLSFKEQIVCKKRQKTTK